MAQLLWVCEPEPKWKEAPNPQCVLPTQVAVVQLVSEYPDLIISVLALPRVTLLDSMTLLHHDCLRTTVY
jgi:hypothetical protein